MRYTGLSLAFSQKERNKHETQNIRIMTPNKADREVQKRKKKPSKSGDGDGHPQQPKRRISYLYYKSGG